MPWKTVAKHGTQVALKIALRTEKWTRPGFAASSQGSAAEKALIEDETPLPPGTATMVLREAEHPSISEWRKHFTWLCYDKKDNYITSIHVLVKEEVSAKEEAEGDRSKGEGPMVEGSKGVQLKDQGGKLD